MENRKDHGVDTSEIESEIKKLKKPSLNRCLLKIFGHRFLISIVILLILMSIDFLRPVLVE